MFCTKCGNEIPEGSKFCPRCGNPVAGSPVAKKSETKNTEEKKPEQSKVAAGKAALEAVKPVTGGMGKKPNIKWDKKKLFAIGAVVVVLVLVLVFKGGGKGAGSGFSSPEKAFDAWMTGFMLHDFDLTLQAEPDFVIEYEGGEAKLKETLQANYDRDVANRAKAGTSKFEAVGHTMLEKDDMEKVVQRMNSAYGVDVKISEMAVIHHRLVDLNDDSKSDEGATGTTGYAFKYKGKWYYLNVESR